MTDWIADAVLVVHFAFVAFVIGGLALIWIGKTLRWGWVRNFWFRIAHLGAIAFVALEAVIGVACPLTVWEYPAAGRSSEWTELRRTADRPADFL